jgi:O-methyltransferase involved in polyketide biosynthesis
MLDGTASRTAMMVAGARAAHLLEDGEPVILRDDVAGRLLGDAADGGGVARGERLPVLGDG